MPKLITKEELKYIFFAGIFSFIYFLYILPWLLNNGVETSPIWVQFLLFSVGIYLVYFFILKSFSMKTSSSFLGAIVMVLPFIALDIVAPEYHINLISGVLEKGATLGQASSDFLIGTLWQNLGITGWILVPMVYFVSFVVILIITALIKKNFVEDL